MIVIPRGLARAFRAVARTCVSGRPRGPAPAVVIEARSGTRTVWTRAGDVVLLVTTPTRAADEVVVVPMAVLDAVEGAGDEPVELCVGPRLRGEAKWADRGVPHTYPFDAVRPGKQHQCPDPPAAWHPVPGAFLAALHECGKTAARDAGGRFALTRVQVQGKSGRVVGTDGKSALLWAGFDLPVAADLLVPAVPVFGSRELAGEPGVRVGRTAAHLVVAAGPWRVHLPVDPGGRFPDVAAVVPKHAGTVAGLDDRDAAELAGALPRLPGRPTSTARSPSTSTAGSSSAAGTRPPGRSRRSTWPAPRPPGRRSGSSSTGGYSAGRSPSGASPSGPRPAGRSRSRGKTRPW